MLLRVLDLIAILAALAAAVLWFRASRHRVRRIARDEELDAADFNRLIVAVNRAQILNSRAAMATAASALALALRMAYDLLSF